MAGFTTGNQEREWPLRGRRSRWESFAQGGPGDTARPSPWQLMILSHLSGPDGRCTGATDDEAFGMLGQWAAAGSWLEGRKLAVLRELIRRHPDERNAGTATDSGLPWDWDECAVKRRDVFPVEPGGTWRCVSGSDGLPEAERLRGQ